jgi:hypothetical protein
MYFVQFGTEKQLDINQTDRCFYFEVAEHISYPS